MAKKCRPCECKPGLPLWLGTFGDLMSLLLCFFVLLLSMATFDKEKIELAIASLDGTFSVLEKGKSSEIATPERIKATPMETEVDSETVENVFASIITEYNEMTKLAKGPAVRLEEAEDGFLLRIPEEILFEPSSAEIKNSDALLLLKRLAIEINKIPNDIQLKVTGHTDNTPIRNSQKYTDNWELSIARGISVTQELLNNRVNPTRLSAGGEGEYNPIATNITEEGRAKNRRVDLYFFSIKSAMDKNSVEKTFNNAQQ